MAHSINAFTFLARLVCRGWKAFDCCTDLAVGFFNWRPLTVRFHKDSVRETLKSHNTTLPTPYQSFHQLLRLHCVPTAIDAQNANWRQSHLAIARAVSTMNPQTRSRIHMHVFDFLSFPEALDKAHCETLAVIVSKDISKKQSPSVVKLSPPSN